MGYKEQKSITRDRLINSIALLSCWDYTCIGNQSVIFLTYHLPITIIIQLLDIIICRITEIDLYLICRKRITESDIHLNTCESIISECG